MPTYEYACRQCGEHLEVVQSFKDDPLTVCPNCDGELRKVFSAAGIIFKGSGWHVKDYASSSSSTTKTSSSESTSSSSSSDSSTSPSTESSSSEKKSA
jgi:putative FmdB family regulatory protein